MLFNGEYSLYEFKKDKENNYSKQLILPEKHKKKLSSEINNQMENQIIKSKEREAILNSHPVFKLNDEKAINSNSKKIIAESLKNNKIFSEKNDADEEKIEDLDVTIQDIFMEIIDDKFISEKLKINNKKQSLIETIKTNKINTNENRQNAKDNKVGQVNDLNDTNQISFSTKQNTENVKRYESKTNSIKINESNKKRSSIIEHIECLEKDLNKMSVIHEENVNLESSNFLANKKDESKIEKVEVSNYFNFNKNEKENAENPKLNNNKRNPQAKIEKSNIKEILLREYDYLYKMYYQVDKNIFDKTLAIKLFNIINNKTTFKSKHLTKILKDFKFTKINHAQFNKDTKIINGPKFVIQMCQQLISEINVLKNLENASLPSLIYYILGKCMLNVLSSNLFTYMKTSIDEVRYFNLDF